MSEFALFSAAVFCVCGIGEIKNPYGDNSVGIVLLACSVGLFYFN